MKTELQKELDNNIPENVIATRQGGNGRSLDYLETWYVIDRLNQVLGQGNWTYSSEVSCVRDGILKTQNGETNSVHYIARVRLVVNIGVNTPNFTDYGYGDGTDKNNPGKAHELAVKEAVSDGLKRCAKNLGRSMGLALYDKTQEYVGTTQKPTTDNKAVSQDVKKGSEEAPGGKGSDVIYGTIQKSAKNSTKELITATFKVLESQGKITKDAFKEKYQGGKAISSLTDDQLDVILKTVRTDFNL